MRASAEDPTAAALMGVESRRVLLLVFALTGLIAAVVAFIWFGQIGTVSPRADFNPTLKAFIAIVLGGLGTVRGAVIGGLTLGMIESGLSASLGSSLLAYQQAFAFGLIILLLLVRPQGIAGRMLQVSK
jgi:branched-chain amino acid transport system permease protein